MTTFLISFIVGFALAEWMTAWRHARRDARREKIQEDWLVHEHELRQQRKGYRPIPAADMTALLARWREILDGKDPPRSRLTLVPPPKEPS